MAEGSSGGGEKTEKPTAKRLADAAKDGDLLQSRELATAMVVMAGVGGIAMTGPALFGAMREMLGRALTFSHADIVDFTPASRSASLLQGLLLPVGGILAATFIAAIAAPAILGSLGFRATAFAPKMSKLNPMKGLARIFGPQGLIELGKSLAKILLMGSIGFWLIWGKLTAIVGLGKADLEPALFDLGSMFMLTCIAMAGVLFLVAGIDVPAQIFQRGKRLAMSKQEIKDEHKEADGNPEIKQQLRQKQYEMLNSSTRKAVAEASVIITNPTHFAVALRYRPGQDSAPVVVARGRDTIAAVIRELGGTAQVPILQYPELARAIYYTSRNGQVVDEKLYMAVATVLAFVFRIENRMASEMDRPFIDVPDDLRFDADGRKVMN